MLSDRPDVVRVDPAVKVTITVSVDFDAQAWRDTFGLGQASQSEVRSDIRNYLEENLPGIGVFGDGEVPAEFRIR